MSALSTLRNCASGKNFLNIAQEAKIMDNSASAKQSMSMQERRRESRTVHDQKRQEIYCTLPIDETEEMPLLQKAIEDLRDSHASVTKTLVAIEEAQGPVAEFGGARHASAVLAARAISVLKRKAGLLKQTEERAAAFERVHASREELNEQLRESDVETPVEYTGTREFLASVVHKGGKPGDADKTDFEAFASSFGLDRKHKEIAKVKQLQGDAVDWWSKKVMQEIENDTTTNHMQRIIRVLKDISEDDELPALKQAGKILSDKLANRVLAAAEELKAQDDQATSKAEKPIPELARNFADRIHQDLRLAASMGGSAKHPKMQAAKGIEVYFRLEEKNRHALKVLLGAKERQERDAKKAAEAEAQGSVPDVGPAVAAAEAIEGDIERAVQKDEVMPSHAHLKEAKLVAKALRDEDGKRRRLHAREKRLQEAGQ